MEWAKLGDIIKLSKGRKVKESNDKSENSIRYIQIEDLRNDDNLKYTNDSKAIIVNKEDILIAWDGANAGTVGFNLEGAIGSTISALEINDSYKEVFYSEFLGYYLKSKNYYLRATATGATIPHISRSALLELKIPNINKEKQLKIVDTFKEIVKLINLRKEQIQAYDDLIESLLKNIINNPSNKKLVLNKFVKEIIAGKSLAGKEESLYKVLKTSCVFTGYFNDMEWKYLPKNYTPKEEHIIKKGDILISRMNTSELVGASAYVFNDYEYLSVPDRLWILKLNNSISKIYLWKFFQSTFYRKQIDNISTGTSGSMKNISQKNFRNIEIIYPPIEMQNKFADYVVKIEEEKKKLRESLEELETLFDALMQDAFSGNLFKD